jgi:hypothetical protein
MNKFMWVCATQLGGSLGMQLWGVTENGRLRSAFQKRPNGPWEEWSEWAGQNIGVVTAAQNGRMEVSLWAMVDGYVFATSQGSVGDVNWGWSKPSGGPAYDPLRPGDPPGQWMAAGYPPFRFMSICACEPSDKGPFGRQLWAVGRDGCLYSTREKERLGGNWSEWETWAQPLVDVHKGQLLFSLTAAQNGKGEVSLWALDSNGVLHCRSQIKAGEDWAPWEKGWVAGGQRGDTHAFTEICACKQGGSLGRALWGVQGNGELWWCYEKNPMGGDWTEWKTFPGPGDTVNSLTAARGQDGRVALWACSNSNVLYNNIQRVAGGDKWAGWDRGGTRQEDFKLTFMTRLNDKDFKPVYVEGNEVALILIDLWDVHWCSTMETRAELLAKKINQLLPAMRKNGVCIIHAPAMVGQFYEKEENDKNGFLRRQAFLNAQLSATDKRKIRELRTDEQVQEITWNPSPKPSPANWAAPLQQDGCDGVDFRSATPKTPHWPPTRQHLWIEIDEPDIVANENESYRILMFLRSRYIRHLVFAGCATNECVLYTRNTSIHYMKQLMTAFSVSEITCYLARDLTDTMYEKPRNAPSYEVHDSGTAATVTWIERHLKVASILSSDLVSL